MWQGKGGFLPFVVIIFILFLSLYISLYGSQSAVLSVCLSLSNYMSVSNYLSDVKWERLRSKYLEKIKKNKNNKKSEYEFTEEAKQGNTKQEKETTKKRTTEVEKRGNEKKEPRSDLEMIRNAPVREDNKPHWLLHTSRRGHRKGHGESVAYRLALLRGTWTNI